MALRVLVVVFALALHAAGARAQLPAPGTPGAPPDSRYCGEPPRWPDGSIKRSWTARQRFVDVWPYPTRPGRWYVDHVLPLYRGGCDLPHNMQWLNAETKTCAAVCKDRPGLRHK